MFICICGDLGPKSEKLAVVLKLIGSRFRVQGSKVTTDGD